MLKQSILLLLSYPLLQSKITNNLSQSTSEYYSYDMLYSFFNQYPQGSIRMTVGRLEQEGLVSQLVRNDIVLTTLSSSGKKYISDLLLAEPPKWDGLWRLIITPSPSHKRSLLSWLNKGVYVTPYEVEGGVEKGGYVVETKAIGGMGNREAASMLWELDKLALRYGRWISEASASKKDIAAILFSFIKLREADPQLPASLLPTAWPAEKALQVLYKFLKKNLRARK